MNSINKDLQIIQNLQRKISKIREHHIIGSSTKQQTPQEEIKFLLEKIEHMGSELHKLSQTIAHKNKFLNQFFQTSNTTINNLKDFYMHTRESEIKTRHYIKILEQALAGKVAKHHLGSFQDLGMQQKDNRVDQTRKKKAKGKPKILNLIKIDECKVEECKEEFRLQIQQATIKSQKLNIQTVDQILKTFFYKFQNNISQIQNQTDLLINNSLYEVARQQYYQAQKTKQKLDEEYFKLISFQLIKIIDKPETTIIPKVPQQQIHPNKTMNSQQINQCKIQPLSEPQVKLGQQTKDIVNQISKKSQHSQIKGRINMS